MLVENEQCKEEVNLVDWRELLGEMISNVTERDRIASEIGVHPVTLMRWVSGDCSPRAQNLRQLLRALPNPRRMQLLTLLKKVSPDLVDLEAEISEQEIPNSLVMGVLDARAAVPDLLRYWTIARLVLQQGVKQLDPESVGISITVVRCMNLRDGKIRSLRENLGIGTPPWASDLEEKALLLGAESLAGHVTVSCCMEQVGDLQKNKTFLPACQFEHEVSAVACPIMYAGRVAGCLLISSTQVDFFAPEARLALVRAYASLLALAFHPHDFYDPALLSLHIMPPPDVQRGYFVEFRQRVLRLMQESAKMDTQLTSLEAEQLVWKEIEHALLNWSAESP
jgi:hypothetical protein